MIGHWDKLSGNVFMEYYVCVYVCVYTILRHCQYMREKEESHSHSSYTHPTESMQSDLHTNTRQRKQIKPDSYFSDEDASD